MKVKYAKKPGELFEVVSQSQSEVKIKDKDGLTYIVSKSSIAPENIEPNEYFKYLRKPFLLNKIRICIEDYKNLTGDIVTDIYWSSEEPNKLIVCTEKTGISNFYL